MNKIKTEDKKSKVDPHKEKKHVKKKKLHAKIPKAMLEETPMDQLINESKISKILSESITKKVIILILVMLIILPILQDDFYQDDTTSSYVILTKYIDTYWAIYGAGSFNFSNAQNLPAFFKNMNDSVDPSFPIVAINIEESVIYRNSSWANYQFRQSELKENVSVDGKVKVTYCNLSETELTGVLNIGRTFYVCLCLGLAAVYFEKDTQELVLQPLEVMMEIVDNVAKDPINAKNIDNLQ